MKPKKHKSYYAIKRIKKNNQEANKFSLYPLTQTANSTIYSFAYLTQSLTQFKKKNLPNFILYTLRVKVLWDICEIYILIIFFFSYIYTL